MNYLRSLAYGCDDMPEDKNHLGDLKDFDSLVKAFEGKDTSCSFGC